MRRNKGFTLIELMVVILIVAILAAVLAPMLTGRIREAKWTEGRAGAGTIATALRAWCAETGVDQAAPPAFTDIGIENADLAGKYFAVGNYSIDSLSYTAATGAISYTITVTPPATIGGANKSLDATGTWSDGR
jgi:type IV pilus assembly protein PilA